jgi:ribonuclease BN (tRNA processing enzyme)
LVSPEEVALDTADLSFQKKKGRGEGGRKRVNQARKFVCIGDNCQISEAMRNLSQEAHVLVHEATMAEGEERVAVQRGHASALMAGKLAKDVGANLLVLNHFSGKASTQRDMNGLVESAQRQIEGIGLVAAAYDLMEVSVPRTGYKFGLLPKSAEEEDEPLVSRF